MWSRKIKRFTLLSTAALMTVGASPAVVDNLFTVTAAENGLSFDDAKNIIVGMNDTYMWSNDEGKSWTRGTDHDVFKGTQKVVVAKYDADVASAEAWNATSSYATGAVVVFEGKVYRAKWYAEPGVKPTAGEPWTFVKNVPSSVATFEFHHFTGADADNYQKSEANTVAKQKKVIGYFANWQGYKTDYEPSNPDYSPYTGVLDGKGYDPLDVPFDKITHVNYGFMIIDPKTKHLVSKDAWADFDTSVEGGGKNYIGQINQLADQHGVASMVSIGGWSNSVDDLAFDKVTATPEDMDKFTTEAVEFMQKYGFDGIDIDWEYPDNEYRKTKFVALIKQLREKLTAAGKEDDIYYQLSIAVTADHKKMQYIDPKVVKDYVDNVNVMTYDFHGGFDSQTGHNSGLYANDADTDQKFNLSSAMAEYAEKYEVPKNKLMTGLSYYSRGFSNVNEGKIGAASNGTPVGGSWDDPYAPSGNKPWWQIKSLEADAKKSDSDSLEYHWDDQAKAPYIYDAATKEFWTYDNKESISNKVNWTMNNGYGGAIIWEMSEDTPDTAELGTLAAKIADGNNQEVALTAELKDREPTLFLNMSKESFNSKDKYFIYVDGKYVGNTQSGVHYYFYKKVSGDKVTVYRSFAGKAGQKIELRRAPGGDDSKMEVLNSFTLDRDMKPVEVPEIADAVKKITASSKSTDISVAFDRGVFQSKNRYIVRLNGKYIFEAFNGTGYYTNSTNTVDNTSTLTRRNMTVKPGDTVSVSLTAGSPGWPTGTVFNETELVVAETVVK